MIRTTLMLHVGDTAAQSMRFDRRRAEDIGTIQRVCTSFVTSKYTSSVYRQHPCACG